MFLFAFLIEVTAVSLSGVMAPGPVTAVTLGKGNKSPHAGAWVAIGHGIVEFPLMVLIYYGLGSLLGRAYVKSTIAFVGGLLLLFMGIGMLRGIKGAGLRSSHDSRSPLLIGILLTLGNPYFLIWWATVGSSLIMRSVGFGFAGFLLLAISHWLCDLLWLYLLSALSFKGGRFFGQSFQRTVSAICGVLLLFFSIKFVIDAAHVFLA